MSQPVKIKILLKIKFPHFKLEKINSKHCKNFATDHFSNYLSNRTLKKNKVAKV
jgi:hypothetical protein